MRKIKDGRAFHARPDQADSRFVDDDGRPRMLGYAAAIFWFGADNVITPHAHKHMASAHLVVEGRLRIRTFDRLEDRADALIVRPTGDRVCEVGYAAAMTAERDNVHWFAPVTERAATLDVIIDGLDRAADRYVIQPIDPLGGEHRADGSIVAPLMNFEDSMRRYTARI